MAVYDGVEFPEPEVYLTKDDLVAILAGRPRGAECSDGRSVTVRLYAARELAESVRKAQEGLAEELRRPLSLAQLDALTRPVDLEAALLRRSEYSGYAAFLAQLSE